MHLANVTAALIDLSPLVKQLHSWAQARVLALAGSRIARQSGNLARTLTLYRGLRNLAALRLRMTNTQENLGDLLGAALSLQDAVSECEDELY